MQKNMTLADQKVRPAQKPGPLAAAEATPEAPAAPATLPEPLDAVAAGQIPGIKVPPLQPGTPPDPLQVFVVENFDTLPQQAPIDYYDTAAQETVVFNTELLTAEALQAAEQNGSLDQLLAGQAAAAAAPTAEGTSLPAPRPAAPAMKAPKASGPLQTARVRNIQGGPQVSPIQPNPVGQQMARRPI